MIPTQEDQRGRGVGRPVPIWDLSEDDRRIAIAQKAAAGARRALGRRDIIRIEPTPAPILYPAPKEPIPVNGRQWRRILHEVAVEHGIPVLLILGRQRNIPIKLARHHAMYRMATETKMSLADIGRKLDRDHTTVIAGIRAHKKRAGIVDDVVQQSPLSTVFTSSPRDALSVRGISLSAASEVVIKEITSTEAGASHG